MSRPHGANVYKASTTSVVASAAFTTARKNLVTQLENLAFVKVVSLQETGNGVFHGEAVEAKLDRQAHDRQQKPKLVFFDKFGRSRSLLKIGPITLTQCPLGFDHVSAVPTVGELLVGSLVPNTRKSHLDSVLRGWSSDAKPLYELLRILKYGTKSSEFDVRSLLLQSAGMLQSAPSSMREHRDEIYAMARIILWGNVRPLQALAEHQGLLVCAEAVSPAEKMQAEQTRLGMNAVDFVQLVSLKLGDDAIMEAFSKGVTFRPRSPVVLPLSLQRERPTGPAGPAGLASLGPANAARPYAYAPTPYVPTSPTYNPTSPRPAYAVSAASAAPVAAGSGAASGAAEAYNPTSPMYAPTSPMYAATSPMYDQA